MPSSVHDRQLRRAFTEGPDGRSILRVGELPAESLLSSADAVINVSGATDLRKEELRGGPLVYLGTDSVEHEIGYFNGMRQSEHLLTSMTLSPYRDLRRKYRHATFADPATSRFAGSLASRHITRFLERCAGSRRDLRPSVIGAAREK